MKKVLSVVALSVLAFSTAAQANGLTGWYVQGDLGVSRAHIKFDGSDPSIKKTSFDPRVSVGTQIGDVRVAVDYTYIGKIKDTEEDAELSLRAHSLGVSALYDFNLGSPVVPYVGVRLATNFVKSDYKETGLSESESKTKFGYGAIVGAQYKLSDRLAINAGLEYNHIGKFEGAKYNQYGLKAGLRYNF